LKKISIITINYNNASGLEKTLKSVFSQTYINFESIVVDGGSNDSSLKIIDSYDKITKWVSEKDNGIYHAQNKGISLSTGEYCLFLNSGDELTSPDVLEKVSVHLAGVGILYGDIVTIDKKGIKKSLTSPETIDVYQLMISTVWHPSAFIKSSLFRDFGGYNEEFKITGDYEFFIRTILKNNVSTQHVNLRIAIFDLGGRSNLTEFDEEQKIERKKSWELNFTQPVIDVFERKTNLLRSREYKMGKLFVKIFKPILKKS
jgi:glycosyltransferase involved in cell wall biosynthesis